MSFFDIQNEFVDEDVERGNSGLSEDEEQFAGLQSQITTNIQNVTRCVLLLQRNVQFLGTNDDSQATRTQIRNGVKEGRLSVVSANKALKTLGALRASDPSLQQKMKRAHGKLAKDFERSIEQFQEVSKRAARKESECPLRQTKAQSSRSSRDSLMEDSTEDTQEAADPFLSQLQEIDHSIDFNENLIEERDKEIREIESAVVEVNEIFQDIHHLVVEQGDMIGNIESHIDDAAYQTTLGVNELRKASHAQRGQRSKLCWCTLIVLMVTAGLVIVGFLGIKFIHFLLGDDGDDSSSPSPPSDQNSLATF